MTAFLFVKLLFYAFKSLSNVVRFFFKDLFNYSANYVLM